MLGVLVSLPITFPQFLLIEKGEKYRYNPEIYSLGRESIIYLIKVKTR